MRWPDGVPKRNPYGVLRAVWPKPLCCVMFLEPTHLPARAVSAHSTPGTASGPHGLLHIRDSAVVQLRRRRATAGEHCLHSPKHQGQGCEEYEHKHPAPAHEGRQAGEVRDGLVRHQGVAASWGRA